MLTVEELVETKALLNDEVIVRCVAKYIKINQTFLQVILIPPPSPVLTTTSFYLIDIYDINVQDIKIEQN